MGAICLGFRSARSPRAVVFSSFPPIALGLRVVAPRRRHLLVSTHRLAPSPPQHLEGGWTATQLARSGVVASVSFDPRGR